MATAVAWFALAAAGFALAQPSTPADGDTEPAAQQPTTEKKPVTAQQKPPPQSPDSFKPTEEVRADTILTLPSDI